MTDLPASPLDRLALPPWWLVRHAPPLVDAGVCYGASDLAADACATQASAQALADHLPVGVLLWSSPLQRCLSLAQALVALRSDLQLATDARLAEMNFGCWEGQPWDAIPRAALDAWTADFSQHRFGGVESVAELLQRVGQARQDALSQARRKGRGLVWVTHAGVIRAVRWLQQGGTHRVQAAQWPRDGHAFGAWWRVDASA